MERRVSHSDIQNWFTYHSPHESQIPAYAAIRDAGKQLATVILALTPSGPDQTVAIRKVREAVMTANQAIACCENGVLLQGASQEQAKAPRGFDGDKGTAGPSGRPDY